MGGEGRIGAGTPQERFHDRWPELARARDLDERFRRMWDLYLSLCVAGFRIGRVDVEQWVLRRPAAG